MPNLHNLTALASALQSISRKSAVQAQKTGDILISRTNMMTDLEKVELLVTLRSTQVTALTRTKEIACSS